jgi:hypothetical protein
MGQFPASDNDDVETRLRLVVTEDFPGQPLGPVPDDR